MNNQKRKNKTRTIKTKQTNKQTIYIKKKKETNVQKDKKKGGKKETTKETKQRSTARYSEASNEEGK